MNKTKATDLYNLMFPDYPDIVDVKQLQQMLGVSRHLAYDLISSGRIRGIKIGNAYKLPKIKVIDYVLSQEDAA